MSETTHRLEHLPFGTSPLAALLGRPKLVAAACIVMLTVLGWLYLALLATALETQNLLPRAIAVLCRETPQPGAVAALVALSMWVAMILAMMLPSAAPMIVTYAEIADTAARKGERIVSPLMLAGGYVSVWIGFAVAVTFVQILLTNAAWLQAGRIVAGSPLAGVLFVVAGVYQFSALKHACLTQCRQPFPFFFAHWQTTARGVYRLGLRQGLYCLGCCWAMMLLMFAAGVMNVLWMGTLGIIMATEKMLTGRRFAHALGVILIAIGIAIIGKTVVDYWPGRAA